MSVCITLIASAVSAQVDYETLAAKIEPPFALGDEIGDRTYEIINLDGRIGGYAFETIPYAVIPGFSGAPINLFVTIDLQGKFIDAEILEHNEPIFVSGLDGALFHNFVEQYKGKSIFDTLVVGVPYGGKDGASSLIYLDGVTKATASVRIAHETILAASFKVAKEMLQQIPSGPPAKPNVEYNENLDWQALIDKGIATRRLVKNSEVQAAFDDTLWEDDDPIAADEPDEPYLDLWLVDVGPQSVARAVLSADAYDELQGFMEISNHDEPLLVIDAGRHGLVSDTFIRNTSPDLIEAHQDGFPIALRDSDLDVELADGVPGETAMIFRTDRRLGFDPTRDWTIRIKAVREHGSFRPELGNVSFDANHKTDERFFIREKVHVPTPPWVEAIQSRIVDLVILAITLFALVWIMLGKINWLAGHRYFTPIRLSILAFVTCFIGWWGQGQLSIVTPLGVMRSVYEGQSLAFLLYDPFSLLIWLVVIVSFVLWGRGLFCGWLCPFGALQEFAHHLGRLLRLPQFTVPDRVDAVLIYLKYPVLFGLIFMAFYNPDVADKLVEVEPFKTAITTYFIRNWYYVAYAALWLVLGMFVFKSFCKYLCPLGAVMAIGGLIRGRDWIERRKECGSPCQLCKVKCNYGAIKKTGEIKYSECFQCLDCVTIHDNPKQCVPLILAQKGKTL
ncbi:regulatory protein NosR [Amylibacter ulvae]|uniref:Regulatory protein NosR n=1 Tax=Paramylibacter ulvae TaxID=1651968 RepID=A0ABQ3CTP5_9RHOB|nr:4Fe-4S binding protein [Amylibacter ulvae]GHA42488.1 regulatory protein NosR [Amylibacter ulvae]